MFNILDQANRVTYPDFTQGYWQRQPLPEEKSVEEIYAFFTQRFGEDLGTINSWTNADRLAGVFLDGNALYLMRIHNGDKDGHGRPQRWVLYIWREDNFDAATGGVLDIEKWLADSRWPAATPVPLPASVPTAPYKIPRDYLTENTEGKKKAKIDRKNYEEAFPKQMEAGFVDAPIPDIATAAELWAGWTSSVRHGEKGIMVFSNVGGTFKCIHKMPLERSPIRIWEEEDRIREEEEQRRRKEQEEAVRKAAEEKAAKENAETERIAAEEARLLEEKKQKEEREARRQRRRERWHKVLNPGPIGLVIAFGIGIAWGYFLRDVVTYVKTLLPPAEPVKEQPLLERDTKPIPPAPPSDATTVPTEVNPAEPHEKKPTGPIKTDPKTEVSPANNPDAKLPESPTGVATPNAAATPPELPSLEKKEDKPTEQIASAPKPDSTPPKGTEIH